MSCVITSVIGSFAGTKDLRPLHEVSSSSLSSSRPSSWFVLPVSFHWAWKFRGIGFEYGTFLWYERCLSSLASKSSPGIWATVGLATASTLSSGPIPGITAGSSISWSSKPGSPAGIVFRLYLSRMRSPGRFRVQNLLVWSLDPEHKICPSGCQANVQTMLSCACSMPPTSLSAPTCQKRIAPSEPPLQKRPSWYGCHATLLASFLWPRKVWTSCDRLRRSNNLSRWSRDAVTNQLPLEFHLISITVLLWAWRVAKDWPVFGSHSFTGCWLSLLPEMIRPFCGCQCTHLTSAPCPLSIRSS